MAPWPDCARPHARRRRASDPQAARPLPPRRPAPGARAGDAAHDPGAGGRGGHAARRRPEARRLANRALSPFRRQVGAARRRGARGLPHAAPRAARGVGPGRARAARDSPRWAWPTSDSPSRTRRTIASCSAASCTATPPIRSSARKRRARSRSLVDALVAQQQAVSCVRTIRCSSPASSGRSCTASRCSPSTDSCEHQNADAEELTRYAVDRAQTGINAAGNT